MPHPLAQLSNRSLRFWAGMVFGFGALALAVAYISELGFGLHPCQMCYWQRVPFAVLLVIAPVAFFWPKSAKPLLWLALLTLLVSAGLGVFHAGVEWKWWEGPSGCSGGLKSGMTAEELLRHIQQAAVVSCTDAAVRVLGLSMAGWNAFYSLACAALLAFGLKQRRS